MMTTIKEGSQISGWDHDVRRRVVIVIDNVRPWGFGGVEMYQTPKRKTIKTRRAFVRNAYVFKVLA